MVCADDTMIAGDWVDVVAASVEESIDDALPPPLTDSTMEKKKEMTVSNDEDERLSLVLRQQRQKEAQLAFLKEQGLLQEEEITSKDESVVIVKDETTPENEAMVIVKNDTSLSLEETIGEENDPNVNKVPDESSAGDAFAQAKNAARKAGVAAAGGALVAVGAVLTPLPTPGGILLAGAGLGVLSTEFECAKKALDTGKEKLVGLIDSIPEREETTPELLYQTSIDSHDDDLSAISEDTDKLGSSNHYPTSSVDIRTSVQDKARSIGQSIRPFLTDDDAPRKAMDDLNTSTKRVFGTAKGKLNEFVAFALVLDYEAPPVELTTLAATAPSPFAGGLFGSGMMASPGYMPRDFSKSTNDSSLLQEAMSSPLPKEGDDTELVDEKVNDLVTETKVQESAHVERLTPVDKDPQQEPKE